MLVPLAFQPGIWRNGTQYQARGRWYDSNLMRWFEGTLRPWAGWSAFSASTVTGAPRRAMDWLDSSSLLWLMVGTHNHLYVFDRSGGMSDITPAGLTAGRADATNAAGYGNSTYGTGTYGDPRSGSNILLPATVWSLDTLEQTPIACNAEDGKIYSWDLNTSHVAAQCSGSPTSCRGVCVTQEGFIFALGAGGDPRNIQWPDQSSTTSWTPSATNQARSYALQTPGQLMCGLRTRSGTLLFTSTDVHLATYLGLPLVYSFQVVGEDCGIISQAGFATSGDLVAWMSLSGFWKYDGAVSAVESDVGDYVFSRLNQTQRSKVWAIHNSTFGEFTWFYPSGTSVEIDSYVTWNYRENHWAIGSLVRLCGVEASLFTNPIMVDSSGASWTHETGFSYSGASTPYAESGPIEVDQTAAGDVLNGLHNGTHVFDIVEMVPDSLTVGDVNATFYTRFFPTGPETTWGPYTMANPTGLRVSGREARMRLTAAAAADFRVGIPRLDFRMAGER